MVTVMHPMVEELIRLALAEDVGTGDLTARYFVPAGRKARAFVVARQTGVISGADVAAHVFKTLDPQLQVDLMVAEGSRVSEGAYVLSIEGEARSILTGERTALNFLQRLSGIATETWEYVSLLQGLDTRVLDTRKTTPGWRWLEKRAVAAGGGTNHRMGLYDKVMVKDNHLVAEGNLAALQVAIDALKNDHPDVEIELEADRVDQVRSFLELKGVDWILLDNMTTTELREAVMLRGDTGWPLLEASGGVNKDTIRGIGETGVDFISVGALTHSVKAMDLALDFVS